MDHVLAAVLLLPPILVQNHIHASQAGTPFPIHGLYFIQISIRSLASPPYLKFIIFLLDSLDFGLNTMNALQSRRGFILLNKSSSPAKQCAGPNTVCRMQGDLIRCKSSNPEKETSLHVIDERIMHIDRRSALLAAVAASFGAVETSYAIEDEDSATIGSMSDEIGTSSKATYAALKDDTLAYSFEYPLKSTSGAVLPFVLSRKPEKYSSAAPLTADARQRIVCELVSLVDAVTISVSVGNPAGTLRTTKREDWTAKQLAEQVLLDRSTGRITSGQRISLATVEDAKFVTKGGELYCIYEHVSQGSPTLLSQTGTTYRHARAVTAARPGLDDELFLYTLNLSCPEERWADLEEPFMKAVESFTLLTPGKEYIPPNQDPWKFF